MPEISVIVPVYNVEKYLNRCVESILNQTYTDFELILVDDGSTDNCPEKCDDWAKNDSRITVIHQQNGGLSAARNAGIRAMQGEYLLFVDSDDFIHPQMLELLFRAINNGNYDIAVCSLKYFYNENEVDIKHISMADVRFTSHKSENIFSRKENAAFIVSACCKLYKKNVFKNVRFVEGIVYEDLQIMPYILLNSDMVIIIDVDLYFYFSNTTHTSTVNSSLSEIKLIAIDIAYEHYKLYVTHGAFIPAKGRAYSLYIKFIKLNVLQDAFPDIKKLYRKRYRKYFFRILLIPSKYLSVKNKIRFILSRFNSARLKQYFKKTYAEEAGFCNKNNL